MGTYTYSDFKTNMLFELGKREDVDSYVPNWFNASYTDFCTRQTFWDMVLPSNFYFPELLKIDESRATADGVKFVTLPDDCVAIYHVHDTTSDHPLDYYEVREYSRKTGHDNEDSYSKPTKWTRIGAKLYFHPTPDDVYHLSITYRKSPLLLSADSDKTELHYIWDEPIEKLAVIQALYKLKRYDTADVEKKEWINMMGGKLGIYIQDKRSNRTPIEPDYTYKIAGRPR